MNISHESEVMQNPWQDKNDNPRVAGNDPRPTEFL